MTIKKKLYLAYGTLCIISLLSTGLGITSILNLSKDIKDLSGRSEDATYYVGQIDTITSDMQAEQRGMILRRLMNQQEASDGLIKDNLASLVAIHKFTELYRSAIHNSKAIEKLGVLSANLQIVDRLNPAFLEEVRQNHHEAALKLLDNGLSEATDKASALGAELLDLQQQLAHEHGLVAMGEATRANWLMLAILFPVVISGIVVLVIIQRLDAALRLSVTELSNGSEQIASAAHQVATSSQSLANDASNQAAMIEETSAASTQISAMASRNMQNATTADLQMKDLKQMMESGSRQMASATQAMVEIGQASDKISTVLQTIEKIAFQTNILALNAAVEAARAGEAGQGFAVVADEVRSLAQRCATAAKDTSALIGISQSTSDLGRERVTKVAAELDRMATVLASMGHLVSQINDGSREQGQGITQIGKSVCLMEETTQRNASTAEESAAAAEQLNSQSEVLSNIAGQLAVMVGSEKALTA